MVSGIFLIFTLLSFMGIIIVAAAAADVMPMRCNAIHTSAIIYDASNNNTILTFDADLKVYKNENGTGDDEISMTNKTISSMNDGAYSFRSIGAYIDGTLTNCINFDNNNDDNNMDGCYFRVKNSTFLLQAYTFLNGDTPEAILFYGVVDERSFSMGYGSIFSQDQPCETETSSSSSSKYNIQYTQCCTSFVPTYLTTENPPICTAFQSRSTIYNTDDNYSIYATAQYNYTMSDGDIFVHGKLTGPSDATVTLALNDFWQCGGYANAGMTCIFPYFDGDNKFLFLLGLSTANGTNYEAISGRLIIRGNQTLMEEGFQFTAKNDCFYFVNVLDSTKVFSSSFCCSQFSN